MYLYPLDDSDEYTLSEFIKMIKRFLSVLEEVAPELDYRYPGKEIFFTEQDILNWVNSRVPGEFKLTQVERYKYELTYQPREKRDRIRKTENTKQLAKSAVTLYNTTGRLPAWVKHRPEVIDILLDKTDIPSEVLLQVQKEGAE